MKVTLRLVNCGNILLDLYNDLIIIKKTNILPDQAAIVIQLIMSIEFPSQNPVYTLSLERPMRLTRVSWVLWSG